MKRNTIMVGDVRHRLRELPEHSIDCIVTSPPYFGLRDYGHREQLGLEPSVDDWVRDLRAAARELVRVLRPGGTFWLNVGDSYSSHLREGQSKKSLLLGPQKLVLGLAADGWLVRNQIIWHKPNAMPSSVTDRLSNSYEVVWLLAREPRYFFDLDAIRVPSSTSPHTRRSGRRRHAPRRPTNYPPQHVVPAGGTVDTNVGLARMKQRGMNSHPLGKSPGDVWRIQTTPYRGAHFAAYPVALAERAILAGCPERICERCKAPWLRAMQRRSGRLLRIGALQPQCRCAAGWRPGLVLDPFMGSGTTAIAAQNHRRDWLGIELNPDYAEQAADRIEASRSTTQSITQ